MRQEFERRYSSGGEAIPPASSPDSKTQPAMGVQVVSH
jgi:hypothetical protein